MKNDNYDISHEFVPKGIEFVRNNNQDQLRNEVRNTSSYPRERYGDIANTIYNADQNGIPIRSPKTRLAREYYNVDGGMYMQNLHQPYLVMHENQNNFKLSGDKTQLAYFW